LRNLPKVARVIPVQIWSLFQYFDSPCAPALTRGEIESQTGRNLIVSLGSYPSSSIASDSKAIPGVLTGLWTVDKLAARRPVFLFCRLSLSGNRSLEEFAVLLARISLGMLFVISRGNKLFAASQYKLMWETIIGAGIPFLHVMTARNSAMVL
jgi:hypothetical protein